MTASLLDKLTTNNTCNDKWEQQRQALEDTNPDATVWTDTLKNQKKDRSWGGRGQGGRGRSRRTWQPRSIVVEPLDLTFVGNDTSAQRTLLQDATLKIHLPGHVYALLAANGSGKSTLLRQMHNQSIPGFPPHILTFYISHESCASTTAAEYLMETCAEVLARRNRARQSEGVMEALDCTSADGQAQLEALGDEMAVRVAGV